MLIEQLLLDKYIFWVIADQKYWIIIITIMLKIALL